MSNQESYSEETLISLLPWYVNNTLNDAERLAVEQFLQHSAEARQECEMLQQLQQSIQADSELNFHAGELGWKRLQKSLQQEEVQTPTASNVVPLFSQRVKQVLSMAAVLVIAVQATMLFNVQQQLDSTQRLLSASSTVTVASSKAAYQLKLRDQASWQSVSSLMAEQNVNIIEGPSAAGLLIIELDQENLPTTINALMHNELVEYFQAIERE